MLRKEYLSQFRDINPFTIDLDRQKREDDNFILDSNRPIPELEIQNLPKEKLQKFVDKVLINNKLNTVLYSSNAFAESKILKNSISILKNHKAKKKKIIDESIPKYNVGKMRENREVIAQAQAVGDQQLRQEDMKHESNLKKVKKLHQLIQNAKSNNDEFDLTEKYKKNRIKKVFEGIKLRIDTVPLPDIKLNINNVYSRLYHNAVYLRTSPNSRNMNTTLDYKGLSTHTTKQSTHNSQFNVKNVIESSSGKEFTLKITDDLLMKCFTKHSGGPKMKYNCINKSNIIKKNKLENKFENGETFLHKAVDLNQIDMVTYFITKGVDVNMQDDDGNSALHRAMDENNSNKIIIQALLDAKAKLEITNKMNKTPYDLANAEIRKYFSLENKVAIKR